MARIDKMFGMPTEWDAMRDWLRIRNDKLLRYMYERPKEDSGPIASFPYDVDRWLWAQTDLPRFMRNELMFQYTDPEKEFPVQQPVIQSANQGASRDK